MNFLVKCGKCSFVNPSENQFCVQCGTEIFKCFKQMQVLEGIIGVAYSLTLLIVVQSIVLVFLRVMIPAYQYPLMLIGLIVIMVSGLLYVWRLTQQPKIVTAVVHAKQPEQLTGLMATTTSYRAVGNNFSRN